MMLLGIQEFVEVKGNFDMPELNKTVFQAQ